MSFEVKIKASGKPVTVLVCGEELVKDGDVVLERRYVSHEVYVAAGVEHVVWADDNVTDISIRPVPEGQNGVKVWGPAA